MNYVHPVLDLFGAAARNNINPGLTTVQTSQYVRLTVPPNSGAEMILKYSDGSPAVVLGHVGHGKTVLFASTSDTSWNTWGALPSYAPFMHELFYYGISRQTDTFTLPVGGHIHLATDVAAPGNWSGPHNSTLTVLTTIDKDKDEGRSFLTSDPLRWAGVYAPGSAGALPVIAVNTDPEEVDIRHVEKPEMAGALGIEQADIIAQPKTLEVQIAATGHDTNSDIGRNLIPIALILLFLETLFARMFSIYR